MSALKSEMRQLRCCARAGDRHNSSNRKIEPRRIETRSWYACTLELHHRCCAVFGSFGLEELARREIEHARDDVAGESCDLGIQVAHHGVVIPARVLDRVFGLAER